MLAAEIAAQLGRPERRGKHWRCVCPLHQGHSLELADGDIDLLVKCWGGCETKPILTELRNRGYLNERRNEEDRTPWRPTPKLETTASERARIKVARGIWARGTDIADTKAQKYLAARGLPDASSPSLRLTAGISYAPGVALPAMIAAVASPAKKIIGVQVTFLSSDGRHKAAVATPRRTFGVLRDGAVRLAPAGETLGLAEGVETALSASILFNVPVWAALGAARMHAVTIPDCVRELLIFADGDEPGRTAAERTAAAHPNLRTVIRVPPAGCKDFNDALTQRRTT